MDESISVEERGRLFFTPSLGPKWAVPPTVRGAFNAAATSRD